MKKVFTVAVVVCVLPLFTQAQLMKNRWKQYRYEWFGGVGASNFLGELGGANQVGTHAFKDLELSQTRLAIMGGFRYRMTRLFALRAQLTYGRVAGDDKLTTEFFRNYRNLSFRSDIYELSVMGEFSLIQEQVGHKYKLRGVKGQKGFEISPYIFAGIGVFHFNPQAELKDGSEWVDLQPLGTEGQGVLATRTKYSRTQVMIPFGLGVRYAIDQQFSVGLEYGLRYTFTDYIDDVSKTYVDRFLLYANGDNAPQLADRSNGLFPDITSPGAQRGDPRHNDAYMFAFFTVSYKIRTGRTNYPLF